MIKDVYGHLMVIFLKIQYLNDIALISTYGEYNLIHTSKSLGGGMVYTGDSKSSSLRIKGSSPFLGTTYTLYTKELSFLFSTSTLALKYKQKYFYYQLQYLFQLACQG